HYIIGDESRRSKSFRLGENLAARIHRIDAREQQWCQPRLQVERAIKVVAAVVAQRQSLHSAHKKGRTRSSTRSTPRPGSLGMGMEPWRMFNSGAFFTMAKCSGTR